MGIYDRNYYREDEPNRLLGGRSMVINIVLFTSICYVAELLSKSDGQSLLEKWFDLSPNLFERPWLAYQLLTYGFMHDSHNLFHVFWNMLALWFFGRDVEMIYGPMEFLRIYLTLIVMSGLVWLLSTLTGIAAPANVGALEGASGAVMGITMIFTMHFPTRLIYIWGILPVPAWAMMLLYIVGDMSATSNQAPGDYVAHVAHLAGVLFGFIYYRSGWNLGRMLPGHLPRLLRPRLKLHDPEPEPQPRDLAREVDQILEKISREGEASLTPSERRTLEEASKRYQRRRQ